MSRTSGDLRSTGDARGRPVIGRREVVAGGMGALLAAAAQALAAPSTALAADHDPIRIGEANSASNTTSLELTGGVPVLRVTGHGHDGVSSEATTADRSGVYGFTTDSRGIGVTGRNTVTKTAGSLGGEAGVSARAPWPTKALSVTGAVHFSRSGVAMVPANSLTAHVPLDLSPASFVLATLQHPAKDVFVRAAYTVKGNQFVIHLNRKCSVDLPVAWLVID